MGWTVVTRNRKQKRRMVQIFVKMDGARTVPMEVSFDAKVRDLQSRALRSKSENDQDVYVMSDGRVLNGSEELGSCGVRDGSAVQVVRRLSPKKVEHGQSTTEKSPSEADVVFEAFDRGGWSAKMMKVMLGMDDVTAKEMLKRFRSSFPEAIEGLRRFLRERRRREKDQQEATQAQIADEREQINGPER